MKLMFNGKINKDIVNAYIFENKIKMHTFEHDEKEVVNMDYYPIQTICDKVPMGTNILIKYAISDEPIVNARGYSCEIIDGILKSETFSCKCGECKDKLFEYLEVETDSGIVEITDIFDENMDKFIHFEIRW